MSVGRRLAAYFVAPAGGSTPRDDAMLSADGRQRRADASAPAGDPPTRACAVPVAGTPTSLGVLAPAADAPALAAVLALALARRHRAPVAMVCVWSTAPARPLWRAPALPAAARLAAALAARGHEVRASGRLVLVRLAAEAAVAAAEAQRATAAAGPAPTVVVLGGPRAAVFEAVLAAQDLVVVAVAPGSDPALARLALAGLPRALSCEIPTARHGRLLAAAGVALLPSARRAFAAPVSALS